MNKQEQQQFFEEVLAKHKGILIKVARTYCRVENEVEDLLQEMLIQIWQSGHKYDNRFKISTWLYRISLNVAISYYRKNKATTYKHTFFDIQTTQIAVEDQPEAEKRFNLLEQFIAELKEIDKALMVLYLDDRSHAEIAEILGLSVSNVGTKIGRIKEKLRIRFSQLNKTTNEGI